MHAFDTLNVHLDIGSKCSRRMWSHQACSIPACFEVHFTLYYYFRSSQSLENILNRITKPQRPLDRNIFSADIDLSDAMKYALERIRIKFACPTDLRGHTNSRFHPLILFSSCFCVHVVGIFACRYICEHAELLRFASCAHLLHPVPDLLIVEDFRTFFSQCVWVAQRIHRSDESAPHTSTYPH